MIEKLPEDVINKIAAGEVVQRPASAIKELIENSIDAGAKNIKVKTKKGGLDQIWVEDDGSGISKEDLKLAGVRYATSKLKKYDDLKEIESFGFRGEALASISHVSNLTITSKPASQNVSYKIQFTNGIPVSDAVPSAGKNGTIIMAKDLFHNMYTRKRSYNAGEEQSKISEIIKAYAIHYNSINFTLFKLDNNITQLRFNNLIEKSKTIEVAFKKDISKNLENFSIFDDLIGFKCEGLFTNSNYAGNKTELLIFINNRLIQSKTIKQRIEAVFSDYLPKGSHPW